MGGGISEEDVDWIQLAGVRA